MSIIGENMVAKPVTRLLPAKRKSATSISTKKKPSTITVSTVWALLLKLDDDRIIGVVIQGLSRSTCKSGQCFFHFLSDEGAFFWQFTEHIFEVFYFSIGQNSKDIVANKLF